jgi:hypothetical protein
MQPTACTICGSKIPPGVAHACASHDYHFPVAIEILAELKRIRELLEQPPKTASKRP